MPEGLVDALRESAQHTGGRALAATDGGSIGKDFSHRRGSVGIAVCQADGELKGFVDARLRARAAASEEAD